jgi:hypothetical protein
MYSRTGFIVKYQPEEPIRILCICAAEVGDLVKLERVNTGSVFLRTLVVGKQAKATDTR